MATDDEDFVDWATRTGRIAASAADEWRERIDGEVDGLDDPEDRGLTPTERLLRDLPPGASDDDDALNAALDRLSPPARPVAASAARPWGGSDPVSWAQSTHRVAASSAPFWRAQHRDDPQATEAVLRQLFPVAPLPLAASAGREYGPDPIYDALFDGQGQPRHPSEVAARTEEIRASGGYMPPMAADPNRPASYPNFVEEIRLSHPEIIAAAERSDGALPELFPGSGDYPSVTASGVDPRVLDELPWRVRLVAAADPSRPRVVEMVRDFGGDDGEELARMEYGDRHPVVGRYMADVWLRLHELATPRPSYAVEASAGDDLADAYSALYPA